MGSLIYGAPMTARPFISPNISSALPIQLEQIDLTLPWSAGELSALIDETVARNGLDNVSIRVVATGGPASDYMTPQGEPSLVIMVTPAPVYPEAQYTEGCKAMTVEMIRERPTVKSLNYIGAIVAVGEAKEQGAIEALYRTADNHITEGTRANFFLFKGNRLITPEVEILPGITRMAVLKLAGGRFDVVERAIHADELAEADEAFITSSTKEVLPIIQIDETIIGDGKPGANTRFLLDEFRTYAHGLVP